MLWEPETILQTGSALKILTSEVLASAGQQILGATIMTGLMAGLTIPLCMSLLHVALPREKTCLCLSHTQG